MGALEEDEESEQTTTGRSRQMRGKKTTKEHIYSATNVTHFDMFSFLKIS